MSPCLPSVTSVSCKEQFWNVRTPWKGEGCCLGRGGRLLSGLVHGGGRGASLAHLCHCPAFGTHAPALDPESVSPPWGQVHLIRCMRPASTRAGTVLCCAPSTSHSLSMNIYQVNTGKNKKPGLLPRGAWAWGWMHQPVPSCKRSDRAAAGQFSLTMAT